MKQDYLDVTELAGEAASQEQVERLYHRYAWAGACCAGKDVIEAGCGAGLGLGYLARIARTLRAGDCSEAMVNKVRAHYGTRIPVSLFDAQRMPFADGSADVVILFEAIYYLPDAGRFVKECRRVLRPGGRVLIATANKDLFDFNPSPHSRRYYGVVELDALFRQHGFSPACFGAYPASQVAWRQKMLRPVKSLAARCGWIPKTMSGKRLLKRIVFGTLVPLPAEIADGMAPFAPPVPLAMDRPDTRHKVLYCTAALGPA